MTDEAVTDEFPGYVLIGVIVLAAVIAIANGSTKADCAKRGGTETSLGNSVSACLSADGRIIR